MAFGLTPQGFISKQQSDIKAELQASFQSTFGQDINLSDESVFGQIIGIFSERESLVWQLGEAVYNSQYPEGAEGASVDNILALSGLKRLAARPSTVSLVLLGAPGTLIPALSIVSAAGNPQKQFLTDNDVIIAASQNSIQQLVFTATPTSGNFQIKIGLLTSANIPFSANAAAVQAAINALSGYSDVTVAGSYAAGFTITFAGASGAQAQPLIIIPTNTLETGTTVVNISVVDQQDGQPAQGLTTATCSVTGPVFAAAGTLSVIGSPISGWSSVNNPADAIIGADIESDTDALIRRSQLLATQGNGTLNSIVEKVRLLLNVTHAKGFQNLNLVPDGFGRPGKSFEVVVAGGSDQDIAKSIYDSKPAGIQSFGSTEVDITDSSGFINPINFSRPTLVPIYITINLAVNSKFPNGGAQQIQQEIIAIGAKLDIGDTVIIFGTNGLVGAFNDVPGIVSYQLFAGTSPSPTLSNNIVLQPEQLALFETALIIINFV